jgi:hypothetical protein
MTATARTLVSPQTPDEPQYGDLALSRYAEVGAALRHFPRQAKAEVLDALGLSASAWDTARTAWSEAIRTDATGELLAQWSAAFEKSKERLQEEQPTLEALKARVIPVAAPALPTYLAANANANASAAVATPAPAMNAPANPAPAMHAVVVVKKPELAGTVPLETSPSASSVLPFRPRAEEAPVVKASSSQPANDGGMPRISRKTVDVPASSADRVQVLPFRSAAASSVAPSLTVEQYASLKAELAAFPLERATTLVRYQASAPGAMAELDAMWRAVFASDPEREARYRSLFIGYHQWLVRKRPPEG